LSTSADRGVGEWFRDHLVLILVHNEAYSSEIVNARDVLVRGVSKPADARSISAVVRL